MCSHGIEYINNVLAAERRRTARNERVRSQSPLSMRQLLYGTFAQCSYSHQSLASERPVSGIRYVDILERLERQRLPPP
jgi:hypothetical protein